MLVNLTADELEVVKVGLSLAQGTYETAASRAAYLGDRLVFQRLNKTALELEARLHAPKKQNEEYHNAVAETYDEVRSVLASAGYTEMLPNERKAAYEIAAHLVRYGISLMWFPPEHANMGTLDVSVSDYMYATLQVMYVMLIDSTI
jgi:hypothetical protein